MQIDMLFKIAGIGILVMVISQILTRAGRDGHGHAVNDSRAGYRAIDGC